MMKMIIISAEQNVIKLTGFFFFFSLLQTVLDFVVFMINGAVVV